MGVSRYDDAELVEVEGTAKAEPANFAKNNAAIIEDSIALSV